MKFGLYSPIGSVVDCSRQLIGIAKQLKKYNCYDKAILYYQNEDQKCLLNCLLKIKPEQIQPYPGSISSCVQDINMPDEYSYFPLRYPCKWENITSRTLYFQRSIHKNEFDLPRHAVVISFEDEELSTKLAEYYAGKGEHVVIIGHCRKDTIVTSYSVKNLDVVTASLEDSKGVQHIIPADRKYHTVPEFDEMAYQGTFHTIMNKRVISSASFINKNIIPLTKNAYKTLLDDLFVVANCKIMIADEQSLWVIAGGIGKDLVLCSTSKNETDWLSPILTQFAKNDFDSIVKSVEKQLKEKK